MDIHVPTLRGVIKFEAYPNSRDDGEVSNNKAYSVDSNGVMTYNELPELVPEEVVPIEKTASFQLALVQNNGFIRCTGAAAKVVTVPLEATLSLPLGFRVDIAQEGSGSVTITPEGGVTLYFNVNNTLVIKNENNAIVLIKESEDEWSIFGALIPV